jgi:Protein of unknown function (DUF3107)
VISFIDGPDAIETQVTAEVDALSVGSRSGLGSVEVVETLRADRASWSFAVREVAGAAPRRYRPLASFPSGVHGTKGSSVEVKIGVTDSARELIFNSAQTPSEVEKAITDALGKDSGVLTLTDEKGRRFLVQTAKIAYVEIGAADVRRVGFGVGADSAKTG